MFFERFVVWNGCVRKDIEGPLKKKTLYGLSCPSPCAVPVLCSASSHFRAHLIQQVEQLQPFLVGVHSEALGHHVVLGCLQLVVTHQLTGFSDGCHIFWIFIVFVWFGSIQFVPLKKRTSKIRCNRWCSLYRQLIVLYCEPALRVQFISGVRIVYELSQGDGRSTMISLSEQRHTEAPRQRTTRAGCGQYPLFSAWMDHARYISVKKQVSQTFSFWQIKGQWPLPVTLVPYSVASVYLILTFSHIPHGLWFRGCTPTCAWRASLFLLRASAFSRALATLLPSWLWLGGACCCCCCCCPTFSWVLRFFNCAAALLATLKLLRLASGPSPGLAPSPPAFCSSRWT